MTRDMERMEGWKETFDKPHADVHSRPASEAYRDGWDRIFSRERDQEYYDDLSESFFKNSPALRKLR